MIAVRSLLLLLCISWALPTAAAPMQHHDLASLWFLAEYVVTAEQVSQQHRIEEWNTTTTYRVDRVLKGDIQAGAEVEVYDDAYSLEIPPQYDYSDPAAPVQVPASELEPMVYLFLEDAPPRLIAEGVTDGEGLHQKVPSGLRVVAGGGVYRMEQWSNPGAYRPVPQGPDPEEMLGYLLPSEVQALSVEAFEVELREAAHRAQKCAMALSIPDPGERNATLLQLLSPPRQFPRSTRVPQGGFASDALSVKIQHAVGESGDLDAYLEAMGRDVEASMWAFDGRSFLEPAREVRGLWLIEAAEDRSRPSHQRDAALQVIAQNSFALSELGAEGIDRLAALLEEPNPWVRAAAVRALGSRAQGDRARSVVNHLVAGARKERSPEVLVAYGRQLRTVDAKIDRLDPVLASDRSLVLAARPGPRPPLDGAAMTLGYAFVVQHHEWSPTLTLSATAVDAEGEVRTSASTRLVSASGGQDVGHGLAEISFDPPLEAGAWLVSLRAHLEPYEIERAALETTAPMLEVVIPSSS